MSNQFPLHPAQTGLGDMDPADFRETAHQVADLAADYLGRLESYSVLPPVDPGWVRGQIPQAPPENPEPMAAILEDYLRLIEPNITHWQHPGFMAYFPSVASGPGILGEWLAAALNSNVMFWRNAPASTELEETVVSWLRQMVGLPADFDGLFTDTASVSSLLALVAARHALPGLEARDLGLAGRPEIGRLRLYASTEAHSSIEKAAIVAGVGRAGVRRIPCDESFRMLPRALAEAIEMDRRAGWWPFLVVATLGTTSSTSLDPAQEIAGICRGERLWMHVDAAYAGAAAVAEELRPLFTGWEQADSIVINPHKWLFTPFDASLLLFRRPELFREAFSLVPEYLRVRQAGEVHNFHEYGIQLGRRFRALKLWLQIRYFGAQGIAGRIREHCRLARLLARWVEAAGDWELMAPLPLATLCLRHRPPGMPEGELDAHNEKLMEEVNRCGKVFLSHTKLNGKFTVRVSIGNPRQTERHVAACWDELRRAAGAVI